MSVHRQNALIRDYERPPRPRSITSNRVKYLCKTPAFCPGLPLRLFRAGLPGRLDPHGVRIVRCHNPSPLRCNIGVHAWPGRWLVGWRPPDWAGCPSMPAFGGLLLRYGRRNHRIGGFCRTKVVQHQPGGSTPRWRDEFRRLPVALCRSTGNLRFSMVRRNGHDLPIHDGLRSRGG